MKFLALFFSLVIFGIHAEKASYTGHKVVELTPQNDEQLHVLTKIENDYDDVQYWIHPTKLGHKIRLQLNEGNFKEVLETFESAGIDYSISVEDVQKLIDETDAKVLSRKLKYRGLRYDFYNYHPYNEIVDFTGQLSGESPWFSSSVIGTTLEGRDIIMGQISTGNDPNKPVVILECGIHAREWVSPASCLWIMNQLATQYGTDADVTSLVDSYDFAVIPVVNPDGYQYTWDSDRLWRKNRAVNTGSVCRGVDNNRNFDANFGGVGSSASPCSETYHGTAAFSELESQAVRSALDKFRPRVKAFVSIHSHAQLWMSPFGYTSTLPADYDEMYRVMGIGVAALEATHGTQYVYGDEASILYLTSGTTRDYAYEAEGIVYSFTIELRDRSYGFVAPSEEILPTAEELWNGIKAMAKAI